MKVDPKDIIVVSVMPCLAKSMRQKRRNEEKWNS